MCRYLVVRHLIVRISELLAEVQKSKNKVLQGISYPKRVKRLRHTRALDEQELYLLVQNEVHKDVGKRSVGSRHEIVNSDDVYFREK